MKKSLFVLALILGYFSFFVGTVKAESLVAAKPVQEISSFELFWPVVAGKTVDDNMYFLKSFKEKLRGSLIFSDSRKMDYDIFLSVKRVVESEKLVDEGKADFAKTTVGEAENQVTKAKEEFVKGKEAKVDFGEVAPQIIDRLSNMEKLIVWLSSKNEQNRLLYRNLLQEIKDLKAIMI